MSRIGNLPVEVPKEVTVESQNGELIIGGPKGKIQFKVPSGISVHRKGDTFEVTRKGDDRRVRALHGFVRAGLKNAIVGVTSGWAKTLELSGVGYRAGMSGNQIVLSVGFSHPVTITPPEGITFEVREGKIIISGVDKQLVGEVAAGIRATKKPEPYKGKGIKYAGEKIRKKAGKSAKAIGGAPGTAVGGK